MPMAFTGGGAPLAQFRQTAGQKPTPRNTDQVGIDGSTRNATDPNPYGDHISYGIITDVNFANYQVKVKLLGEQRHEELESEWQRLITQQDEIFSRWGQLRRGMHCRVHWRGSGKGRYGFVEIIGDEETNFVKQKDKENQVKTFPYKFLGGGLTSF